MASSNTYMHSGTSLFLKHAPEMCEFKQRSGELYFPLGYISQYRAAATESRLKMNNLKVVCCVYYSNFPSDWTVRVLDLEPLDLSWRLGSPSLVVPWQGYWVHRCLPGTNPKAAAREEDPPLLTCQLQRACLLLP